MADIRVQLGMLKLFGVVSAQIVVPFGAGPSPTARLKANRDIDLSYRPQSVLKDSDIDALLRLQEKSDNVPENSYTLQWDSDINVKKQISILESGDTAPYSFSFLIRPEDKIKAVDWPGFNCSQSNRY